MAQRTDTQTITSTSEQKKSVPVVTVESFYTNHAEKLQMKLEGPRVGFQRKIREPTINRPGLALSGFYSYFAEKRVQVLGAAEHAYLKSLSPHVRQQRFRELCACKIPCLVMSRGFHLAPDLLEVTTKAKIAVFRTPMITMKFI
ncbi:MAG TPA: HPr(Ser) kinase/phosphatase, partial [Chthoniobacterales bacterium]|nr:HPr(Ser) kinase/phosphatase [Chthoniobacterales bacterium]